MMSRELFLHLCFFIPAEARQRALEGRAVPASFQAGSRTGNSSI